VKRLAKPIGILQLLLLFLCACGSDVDFSRSADRIQRRSLPIWATAEEQLRQLGAGPPPEYWGLPPPAAGYRVPAEFEPMAAVLMTWADYPEMLASIAEQVAAAGAEVWMVGGPSSLPGVPVDKYRQLSFYYDSVWTRDYGPVGILEADGKLGIIDTTYRHWVTRRDDDAIPCQVAQAAGALCYSTSLIMDGGNFMTDGRGNVFFTERLYEWNSNLSRDQVDGLLREYLGAENLHVFAYARDSRGQPADGTGHLDMFAKIIGDCDVLVAEYNQEPYFQPLEQAAAYFSALSCPGGGSYRVHRLPGWSRSGVWYTYTNALLVNGTLLLPSYRNGYDDQARQVISAARPDLRLVFIASDASIVAGGSVHCVTREIPAEKGSGCRSAADCQLPQVEQSSCVDGVCGIVSCTAGWADCNALADDGCETRLGTAENCSACADRCAFANATAVCQDGSCRIASCDLGWADCNTLTGDGCETQLGTLENCSACADRCAFQNARSVCASGRCQLLSCNTGFADCNHSSADGCESDLSTDFSCGSCANSCRPPARCQNSAGSFFCACPDADGDGFTSIECGGSDCNDSLAEVNPGVGDECNGRDDDCDGQTDEGGVCRQKNSSSGCGCSTSASAGTCWFFTLMTAGLLRQARRKKRWDI